MRDRRELVGGQGREAQSERERMARRQRLEIRPPGRERESARGTPLLARVGCFAHRTVPLQTPVRPSGGPSTAPGDWNGARHANRERGQTGGCDGQAAVGAVAVELAEQQPVTLLAV